MSDWVQIIARLEDVLAALVKIPKRVSSISSASDFIADETGHEHLDSVCMILIAVGEALRQIDDKTDGDLRAKYPQVPWSAVIGVRNVIAHGYFDIDHEQIFAICEEHVPKLSKQVEAMIRDLKKINPTTLSR